MSALVDAFGFVQAFCAANAVRAEDALRVKLVVEELFTNSVRHGYGVEGDAPIVITLDATADAVELRYEDEAPPFDPTSRFPAVGTMPVGTMAERPVGGLGLRLVGEMVRHACYVRADGCNRLRLVMPRTASPG